MCSTNAHVLICLVTTLVAMALLIGPVAAADRPADDYVATAQSECFSSKRIMSCFRYKAARYLWSAANGRLNFFDQDNSRTLKTGAAKDASSSAGTVFNLVQLTEPSTELVFPEARQQAGGGAPSGIWQFLKRSWAAFLNAHGIRFGLDGLRGARVLTPDDGADERSDADDARLRKKKWQVIIPLAILGKLMHLKMMVMQILFGLGAIQAILIGGGVLLYYYLKHHTLCRIEPHMVQTHSHVVESSLPELAHSSYAAYPNWGGPMDSSAAASHPYGAHYVNSAASGGGGGGGGGGYVGGGPTFHKGWDRQTDVQ